MKKIDFHIHTMATSSDSSFTFCLDALAEYVSTMEIDCIAITNHNLFDVTQFNDIKDKLDIVVYPGIELDIEGGQLLLIDDGEDLFDFDTKCKTASSKCKSKKESLSIKDFQNIFTDLTDYILIPHYQKKPALPEHVLEQLAEHISAGEVTSAKKFMYCINDKSSLVPVCFSDVRIYKGQKKFPARQTYLYCDEVRFNTIKSCLKDKNKVCLSENDGNKLFPIFDDGQELSTGLNIILGERSSGKSFTLEKISKASGSLIRYIPQFSLVERDEKEDEKKFNELLSEKHSLLSRDYLESLQRVVNDVLDIDLEQDSRSLERYVASLVKYAKDHEKHDSFSNAKLFREEEFQILDQDNLAQLISSTKNLIENIEFKSLVEKHLNIDSLKALIIDLILEYRKRHLKIAKKKWVNSLLGEIKKKLQFKTATTSIEDVDLYRLAMNKKKINRFEEIVHLARTKREIVRKQVQGFTVVAEVSEFEGAGEIKKVSKSTNAFSDAFSVYASPYQYLQALKQIDIEDADIYKFFVKIDYKILNKDGYSVSGGERSEFNLLQQIQDAQKYDMLLIDEPESSFDNIFLNSEVNGIIKELSKNMPVVIVTHNNTVGASIKPDYLLCTRKEINGGNIEYRIYSGFPNNKNLISRDGKSISTYDATLGCLEAGEAAYNERSQSYENLKN